MKHITRIGIIILSCLLCITTGCSYTFEDAAKEGLEFSYEIISEKTEYKRGETIELSGTVKNISNKTITFIGLGGIDFWVSIYCETEVGKYFMPNNDETTVDEFPTSEPWKCEYLPGRHTQVLHEYIVPEDAPVGNYHLLLRIQGENVEYVFENVLTIVE